VRVNGAFRRCVGRYPQEAVKCGYSGKEEAAAAPEFAQVALKPRD